MDYLERAYYDSWDFSFSGQPFEPYPPATSESPTGGVAAAVESGDGNTRRSAPGARGAREVPPELVAAAVAGATMLAMYWGGKGIAKFRRWRTQKDD